MSTNHERGAELMTRITAQKNRINRLKVELQSTHKPMDLRPLCRQIIATCDALDLAEQEMRNVFFEARTGKQDGETPAGPYRNLEDAQ